MKTLLDFAKIAFARATSQQVFGTPSRFEEIPR
jgi:hypothetical protein